MTEKPHVFRGRIARLWDRVVRVNAASEDEEYRRVGVLFNTLMVVAMIQGLALGISLIAAWRRGYLADETLLAFSALSLFGFLPASFFAYVFVKRGYLRQTIPYYVRINLLVILATGILVGGSSSVGWIMLFWPITLAGTLMKSGDTFRYGLISVFFYITVAWVQGTGRYIPPIGINARSNAVFNYVLLMDNIAHSWWICQLS